MTHLSVVAPFFNEEESIESFLERVTATVEPLKFRWELILVDDGSTDNSFERAATFLGRAPLTIVKLARNFGHQNALIAGIGRARGNYVVTLDSDLQDPPELLPTMLAIARDKRLSLVTTARLSRKGESWFKVVSARIFYRLIHRISNYEAASHSGDFRLMAKDVVQELLRLSGQGMMLREAISWLGYKSEVVEYDRPARAAGRTKYSMGKMVELAMTGLTAASDKPLIWGVVTAQFALLLSTAAGFWVLLSWFFGTTTPGWASLAVVTIFMGSVNLFFISIVGVYVGQIFRNSLARPRFVVSEVIT